MTQERIVITILFITFLVVAYKMVRMLFKKQPMSGSTACSSGACTTCAFKENTSCADKTYTRSEVFKIQKVKLN